MATQSEVGFDPLLESCQAQLLETCDLPLREGLVREVGERRATPERERRAQRLGGSRGLSSGEKLSTINQQALEPGEVEFLGLEPERVPVAARSRRPFPSTLRSRET